MSMLEKCMKAYKEFEGQYSQWNYCVPDDGGFDYLSRLNDFGYILSLHKLVTCDEYNDNFMELKFDNEADAKTFFEATRWLKGKDRHFTSCEVMVTLKNDKVSFIGYEW